MIGTEVQSGDSEVFGEGNTFACLIGIGSISRTRVESLIAEGDEMVGVESFYIRGDSCCPVVNHRDVAAGASDFVR